MNSDSQLNSAGVRPEKPNPTDIGSNVLASAILNTVSALIIMLDRQGRILNFNRACEEATGYESSEAIGRPFWDFLLLPEEKQGVQEVFQHLLAGEFPNQHENYWVTCSGEHRLISWTNTAIYDQAGSVEYVIGTGIDITERRVAQEALRESEKRYRSLFKNNHAVMLLIDPQTGDIVDANPAACSFYGYRLEELTQMKITEINTLGIEAVFVEMERARSENRNHFYFQHRLANGEVREVEVYSGPIPVSGKELLYSIVHDITDRKHAEESLKESEARERARAEEMETLMDTVPAAIWVAQDPECRIVTGNRAAYELFRMPVGTNLSKTEPHESAMSDIHFYRKGVELGPDELPLQLALSQGAEIREFEEDIVYESGEVRHMIGNVSPLKNSRQQLRGAVAAFIDISELKRAEEALRRYAAALESSNRDLQNFAFIASHDLQEPLRKIRAFGELLEAQSRGSLNQQSRQYLGRMIFAAERMGRMIDDLLSYSRITTRAQPFTLVDLNRAVEDALADLEIRILSTGGRVELGQLPFIEGDPTQLHLLFQNLIANSLKFHRPGVSPLVKVYAYEAQRLYGYRPSAGEANEGTGKLEREEEVVQIIVEDNGIGFDMEYAERIFQPFQRLHGRSEYEGSGIGLAICRRIAERHRGSISVQSVADQGSTFVVTLPVRQPDR